MRPLFIVACFVFGQIVVDHPLSGQENWPQFRGAGAAGVGTGSPPVTWNVESGENVKWKTKIAGLGHSSPVVWGNRLILTTAVNSESDEPSLKTGWAGGTGKAAEDSGDWTWQVICLDTEDGEVVWKRDVAQGEPEIKRHLKASHANCTSATDGEHIVAFFGSEGLYCFDFEGNKLWEKNFGRLHSGPYNAEKLEWGFASSPVIFDGHVIVQCDCLNTAFVAILDIKTGTEIRRIEREDVATWSTPAIVQADGQTQIVCNGYKQMAGYDFRTGEQRWTLQGGGDVPVPTPLFANDLIYLTNGHGRSPIYAIDPSATGDLTPDKESDELPEHLVWWQPKGGSYMPTPIIVDERLYTCDDNGRLTVCNALTGEQIYKQRVGGESGTYSASAVATPSHLYFSNEKGVVFVVKTGDEYVQLAENDMGEVIMATPAIAGDRLLIRTSSHVFCLETSTASQPNEDESEK